MLTVYTPDAEPLQPLDDTARLRRLLDYHRTRALVGNSGPMQTLREQIGRVADLDGPILVCGEPGTGTSLVAGLIHAGGQRGHWPLLRLDCALHSGESLQRALFAGRSMSGDAWGPPSLAGGTLILDRIEDLPQPLQRKVADCISRSGQQAAQSPRVIAVTNADVDVAAGKGRFDDRLWPLVATERLVVVPLRERREDVAPLIEHFVHEWAVREGRPAPRIALDVLELLERHSWPGNVRELRNVVERAVSLGGGGWLTAEMLRPWLAGPADADGDTPGLSLRDMERKLIETTFVRYGGNRERTAAALQIGLRTLSGKLREYGYPPRGGPGSNRVAHEARAA